MADHILLTLHIGFAIFTLGPLTAATMSTPRYIRRRNPTVLRYLHRTTQVYGFTALGIFLFGLLLAEGRLAQVWLSASMTLFIVALVLLLLVDRDQRKAIHLLEGAAPASPVAEGEEEQPAAPAQGEDVAQVERGRIAALSGVIALIWLVILVLMVWNG
ncbi:hypothetical protein [Spirillospora albida]|uniref:hypothetical protein n=1 Tax=Spirillospora albida TaxID=58123 RepID=UPI0004C169FF|nr:hypothetical protein [Spirillospora albida]